MNNIVPTTNNYLSNIVADHLSTGFVFPTDVNALSDHFVEDASFYKIDNITLGFNVQEIFKDINARFFGSVQNLIIETEYKGIDPEIPGGIDNNFYPRPLSIVLGFNIDF